MQQPSDDVRSAGLIRSTVRTMRRNWAAVDRCVRGIAVAVAGARWLLDRTLGYALTWLRILWGFCMLLTRNETPRSAHRALVDLFVRSGGRGHDAISAVISTVHPPYPDMPSSGVLGNLAEADFERIQRRLSEDGYYVFDNCLSAEYCDRIVKRSLQTRCLLHGDDIVRNGTEAVYDYYDRSAPRATWYTLTRNDTTDIPEIQELISDASILRVAQNYLAAKPILSAINLGWSARVKDEPDLEAAQDFHWDMERIKWLRFFIYLTDVTTDTGPHCFIAGSHRTGALPRPVLQRGYSRLPHEEVIALFGQDKYREFTAPRGTIIAEDSRGLHKGMMLHKGDRLLLAFEVSNSLFGANKRHVIRNVHVPKLRDFANRFPRVYSNIDFELGGRDAA